MMHPVLNGLGPLKHATVDDLENAVDRLIEEAGYEKFNLGIESRVMRAEALAILAHEFRRRADAESNGHA